ncbi:MULTISPECIES: hypothetical protein [Methanobacterium]|jgi:type III secretory pathway component EscR|uniref:Putative membrane protein n=1 Tax=Methanobacterium formicicum TaxID=2162 RepID=A0A089ZJ30_METFO|nr:MULTISPECIES: hypothetical protein [Methanobacterium]AIS32988.1 hypothetical protein BRM9_2186 [Methanobacterium formicicum]KUK74757.1 MAG: Uncharacterized protein XD90_0937 [Methanobacterium sp. 42_16]MBF4474807.1 hypothetical protein [Methanobacterium formicicum]MDD4810107.1 hypothetical protein [Methanobacterium formicicum]MDG3548315.1 hypothetical protein [Methanobacterium formicicum]
MTLAEYGPFGGVVIFVAVAIGIANVCLLGGLLYSYWSTYRQVKSKFTIGLLYFSSFLLIQNIVATLFLAISLFAPVEIHGSEISGPRLPLLLINIVQLIALSILLKITRE